MEGTTWSLLIPCQNVNAGRLTKEKWFKGNHDTRSFVEIPDPFVVLCRVRDEGLASSSASSCLLCPAPFAENAVSSSMRFFGLFVKTQVTIEAWAYIWIRSVTQSINVSVFMQAPCYSYCNSFVG